MWRTLLTRELLKRLLTLQHKQHAVDRCKDLKRLLIICNTIICANGCCITLVCFLITYACIGCLWWCYVASNNCVRRVYDKTIMGWPFLRYRVISCLMPGFISPLAAFFFWCDCRYISCNLFAFLWLGSNNKGCISQIAVQEGFL